MGMQKNFFEIQRQFGYVPSKQFVSPDLRLIHSFPYQNMVR